MADDAFFIYQKSGAVKAIIHFAHKLLFTPNTKGLHNRSVFVGNERKGQVEFGFKLFVALHTVGADAYNVNAGFLQSSKVIPQVAGLCGTCRGIVFRVKIDGQFFAFKIFEGNFFSVLIGSGKCWSLCAWLK